MNSLTAYSDNVAGLGGASFCSRWAGPKFSHGKAVIGGVRISDDSHNSSNERTDCPRIVLVGIGGGVALPFMFIEPVHGDTNVK